ncbi:hypothetical protein [Lacinutrix undariae]
MTNDIHKIYHNKFGIAFKWLQPVSKQKRNKVQIVFRDMGFYLTHKEVQQFYNCICDSQESEPCSCCKTDCDTRNILIKTPSSKIDIALNAEELILVEDLIKGTLFQLDLDDYLMNVCKN